MAGSSAFLASSSAFFMAALMSLDFEFPFRPVSGCSLAHFLRAALSSLFEVDFLATGLEASDSESVATEASLWLFSDSDSESVGAIKFPGVM